MVNILSNMPSRSPGGLSVTVLSPGRQCGTTLEVSTTRRGFDPADMVRITKDGCEPLTSFDTKLRVIPA